MSARALLAAGLALLAIAVPTAEACNIQADRDAAVRMSERPTSRDVLVVKKTAMLDLVRYGTHRVGDPWPSAKGTTLRGYPR